MDKHAEGERAGQLESKVMETEERSALDEVLRKGAQKMLLTAIEAEVEEYVAGHQQERDERGHRLVVRNGHGRQRSLVTPVGTMAVRAPRIDDRRRDAQGRRLRFTSKILPPYLTYLSGGD